MEIIFGILGGIFFIAAYNRFVEWRNERKLHKEKNEQKSIDSSSLKL